MAFKSNSGLDRTMRVLGSLRLAVVVLIALAGILAFATIYESKYGTEAARRNIYHAWWFSLLLVVLAVNVAAATIVRWPWRLRQVGFVVTHAAILVILGGCLVTQRFGIHGTLILREGDTDDRILLESNPLTSGWAEYPLGFAVQLNDFELAQYPGTDRHAMYRSTVTVLDGHERRTATIEVNRPLRHAGWTFFQGVYDQAGGHEVSILAVSKDPGQPVVYLGSALLVIGVVITATQRLRALGAKEILPDGANGDALPGPRQEQAVVAETDDA